MFENILYSEIKHLNRTRSQQHSTPAIRPTPVAKHKSHQHCMICSTTAVLGLHIDFYSDQEGVWAIYENNQHQQGFDGIAHGGFSAALLDAVMCQSLFAKHIEAVTADMTVRYLYEIPLNSRIVLKGKVLSSRNNLHKVQGELFVNQRVAVKAEARFMTKR